MKREQKSVILVKFVVSLSCNEFCYYFTHHPWILFLQAKEDVPAPNFEQCLVIFGVPVVVEYAVNHLNYNTRKAPNRVFEWSPVGYYVNVSKGVTSSKTFKYKILRDAQTDRKVDNDIVELLSPVNGHTPHGGNLVQAAINTERRCRNGNADRDDDPRR